MHAVQHVLHTWVSWERHARQQSQEGGSVLLHRLQPKMCALVLETLGRTVPFSVHPKVFLYTADTSRGGCLG